MQKTIADELRDVPMGWIWIGTFFMVVVFGGILTPWDAIQYLLENEGIGEAGAQVLGFVGGYTLPLTVGFGIITFIGISGWVGDDNPFAWALGAVFVLAVCGEAARYLGLGLLPDYTQVQQVNGHPVMRVVMFVLGAYLSTYGWPLMVCALTIGVATAIQVERWAHGATGLLQA